MKLLFCPQCGDVRKLRLRKVRCQCGSAWGRYLNDGAQAEVSAGANVIGIANGSIAAALTGRSDQLEAWLFRPGEAQRIVWKEGRTRC